MLFSRHYFNWGIIDILCLYVVATIVRGTVHIIVYMFMQTLVC